MSHTLVLSSTFPQWENDPRGAFILRHWEQEGERSGQTIRALVPRTVGSTESQHSTVQIERFNYAPRRLSSLTGHFGVLENIRERPWRAGLVPLFCVAQAAALRRRLRMKDRPSLVVAHMMLPCGWIVARECVRAGVPFCIYGHGSDVDLLLRLPAWFRQRFLVWLQHAETVFLPSKQKLDRFVAGLGLAQLPEHFQVEAMLKSVPRPGPRWLARRPVDGERRRVLFVGRLIRQKGVDLMLEAAARRSADAYFDVAGDGPERDRLEALSARLGLDVRFHGYLPQSKIAGLYSRAHLVCVPSRESSFLSEGAPLVIPEARAYRVPVLATAVGGIPELCAGDEQAMVVGPDDVEAFSIGMERLLRQCSTHPHVGCASLRQVGLTAPSLAC